MLNVIKTPDGKRKLIVGFYDDGPKENQGLSSVVIDDDPNNDFVAVAMRYKSSNALYELKVPRNRPDLLAIVEDIQRGFIEGRGATRASNTLRTKFKEEFGELPIKTEVTLQGKEAVVAKGDRVTVAAYKKQDESRGINDVIIIPFPHTDEHGQARDQLVLARFQKSPKQYGYSADNTFLLEVGRATEASGLTRAVQKLRKKPKANLIFETREEPVPLDNKKVQRNLIDNIASKTGYSRGTDLLNTLENDSNYRNLRVFASPDGDVVLAANYTRYQGEIASPEDSRGLTSAHAKCNAEGECDVVLAFKNGEERTYYTFKTKPEDMDYLTDLMAAFYKGEGATRAFQKMKKVLGLDKATPYVPGGENSDAPIIRASFVGDKGVGGLHNLSNGVKVVGYKNPKGVQDVVLFPIKDGKGGMLSVMKFNDKPTAQTPSKMYSYIIPPEKLPELTAAAMVGEGLSRMFFGRDKHGFRSVEPLTPEQLGEAASHPTQIPAATSQTAEPQSATQTASDNDIANDAHKDDVQKAVELWDELAQDDEIRTLLNALQSLLFAGKISFEYDGDDARYRFFKQTLEDIPPMFEAAKEYCEGDSSRRRLVNKDGELIDCNDFIFENLIMPLILVSSGAVESTLGDRDKTLYAKMKSTLGLPENLQDAAEKIRNNSSHLSSLIDSYVDALYTAADYVYRDLKNSVQDENTDNLLPDAITKKINDGGTKLTTLAAVTSLLHLYHTLQDAAKNLPAQDKTRFDYNPSFAALVIGKQQRKMLDKLKVDEDTVSEVFDAWQQRAAQLAAEKTQNTQDINSCGTLDEMF